MEKTGKFLIEAMDLDNAGNASSTIKKILIEEGISKQIIKRVSIAVYEAEINVVIHSYGGTCTYFIDDQKIRIIFEDTGPGIVDIEQALEPGFSTANNRPFIMDLVLVWDWWILKMPVMSLILHHHQQVQHLIFKFILIRGKYASNWNFR